MSILVVGAGLAGLSTADWLSEEGYDVVLVEKTSHLGGQLRTLSYVFDGEKFLFDLGPHIVDGANETWKNLTCNTVNIISSYPESCVKFTGFDLETTLGVSDISPRKLWFLLKHGPNLLSAKVFRRKEENFEDSLVNQYGNSLYRDYVKSYVTNFWKTSPVAISKNYALRASPPKLRNMLIPISKRDQNRLTLLYPTNGIEASIQPLIRKIRCKENIKINTDSTVQRITHSDNKVIVTVKEPNAEHDHIFGKVIWACSVSDLVSLTGLRDFGRFRYNDVLLVNCAVFLDHLLDKNIHTSYIMIPGVPFHRVYEPKKICATMSPLKWTSLCMEITLTKNKEYDLPSLVEKSLKALQKIFSIQPRQMKYLGSYRLNDAYPVPFVGYELWINKFREVLGRDFKNIKLAVSIQL